MSPRLLMLIPLLCVAGCYAPSIASGQFTCETSTKCPHGFVCACGTCVHNVPSEVANACTDDLAPPTDLAPANDLAITVDQSMPDLTPVPDLAPPPDLIKPADLRPLESLCTNGGVRAARDPGVPDVAFCPAAWLVKGINTVASKTTPCNRVPTSNGKNANGTIECSAEDNCAGGWHVCDDETDLATHGLTAALCKSVDDDASELWVTRVSGAPPMPGPGPPNCTASSSRTLFGCGGYGNIAGTACTIVHRVLVDGLDANDDCSTTSFGAFTCVGAGPAAGETTVVQKIKRDNGGVICCRS